MALLLRLMVDRRASAYAGLRSASLGERTAKANNQRMNPWDPAILSFSVPPAAERLRSTNRIDLTAASLSVFESMSASLASVFSRLR